MNDNRLAQLFFEHRGKTIDKWEQYLGIYARELAPLIAAKQPVRLLEIGVQNGGSLELWAKYLPEGSEIIGVDIDPKVGELSFEGNVRAFVADATDAVAMLNIVGEKTFDIIIDDGSHNSPDIIAAFKALYNRLAYGGKFIIEDIHASYWASHHGGFRNSSSAVEFFKGLVDGLNADHFTVEVPAETAEDLRRYNRSLASISFYDSVIVIDKLAGPKAAAYRRMLSGVRGDVIDSFKLVTLLPSQRVETLLLSEPQKHHIDTCFFDWFADAQNRIRRLTERLSKAEGEVELRTTTMAHLEPALAQARAELAEAQVKAVNLENELAILRNSASWRFTAPLRKLVARMRR
jgi:SAM-dependent methyltransferase